VRYEHGNPEFDADLAKRRCEERRAVEEAGGGESEGFDSPSHDLIEHASHGEISTRRPDHRRRPGATRS